MTDKEKQDLNIKLATHFIGIKKIYFGEWDEDKLNPMYIPSGKPWRTHQIDAVMVPRFTDSLDACFTWLVPKFPCAHIGIGQGHDGKWQVGVYRVDEGFTNDETGWGETPALALCLAIEKLIDAEISNDRY